MAEHHHHHDCDCCCDHGHEHSHNNRCEEALSKYNLDINDDEVKAAVKKIIAEKVHENDTLEVKKFLM